MDIPCSIAAKRLRSKKQLVYVNVNMCCVVAPPSDVPSTVVLVKISRIPQCPTCRDLQHSAMLLISLHTVSTCLVVKMNPRIIVVLSHSDKQEHAQQVVQIPISQPG